ncbi:hypothetical protein [Streptomyces sp. NBC_00572]|uniref:hypothetical protein n=1 Tax=Streptomyces sp. NBC_00572 TaxID=2903664 RepID=UPI002259005B|nr:hypothetical protein [Streptomyces sp. NBC_00572]MCX4985507.1 hypothetical protein [Streptomyces sp. NBC_00572]
MVAAHLAEGGLVEPLRHHGAYRRLLHAEFRVEPSLGFARRVPRAVEALTAE